MPKRVSTRPQASNTDDTTIKFQYSFMSVPKFHDLSNNGTKTTSIINSFNAHTHFRPVTQYHSGQGQCMAQYGIEKRAILISGASYFFYLVYMVRLLSRQCLLVLHYLFYMAHVSDLYVSSTTGFLFLFQQFILVFHYLFKWPMFLIYMWVLLLDFYFYLSSFY